MRGRTFYTCPLCERRTDHSDYISIDHTHDSRTSLGRFVHAAVRHRVFITGRILAQQFEREWGDLARYNMERANGLLHDSDTGARMAKKQRRYNQRYLS